MLIAKLAEMAIEEAEGAKNYAKLANDNKKEYPQMAEAVYTMATQEITHATTLLTSAKTLLENSKHEDHDKISYLFEYLYNKATDEIASAKMCMEKYKTM